MSDLWGEARQPLGFVVGGSLVVGIFQDLEEVPVQSLASNFDPAQFFSTGMD